jgi:hypothetical protein
MTQQTAVEWLVSNIDWMLVRNSKNHYKMIIEQAKEMEKQQIIDFSFEWAKSTKPNSKECIEQYYNETFKQKEQ